MQNKTFRLFISSTFNDLQEERNILQEEVFPEIKTFCKSYGYNFEPIDLRWGVSNEAGLDHKAMEICIKEVEKVFNYPRPNFLIMLGNRYGWIPSPAEIEDKYYEQLFNKAKSDEQKLLSTWYKKDENSIPSKYILQPIDQILCEGNENLWFEEIESQIISIIVKYKEVFPSNLYIGKSATEQEIIKGVLNSAQKIQNADNSVLCMTRNIKNIDEINDPVFLENDQSKLDNLKDRLKTCLEPKIEYKELSAKLVKKEDTLKPDKEYLEDYAIEVKSFLKEKILNEIKRLTNHRVDLEDKTHEKFKIERSKVFIGHENILRTVDKYVESDDISPLVIYGESGVGKSAFISKFITSLENKKDANIDLLYRFVGVSEISSQPKSLLDNLIMEIAQRLNKETKKLSKDYSESINRFISSLNQYSNKSSKKLVIIIDALDQFETKNSLEWIEEQLPNNIKMIVSTLPSKDENGLDYGEYFNILKAKVPKDNIYQIEKLDLSDGKAIIDSWLESNNKQLTSSQLSHILNLFKNNGLPLYLKIIFDQALSWRSFDENYKDLNDTSLIGAIRSYFKDLVVKRHHARMLVEHTIGYISASKNGLSENEIVEVLSSDHIIMQDISNPYHKLPTTGTDKLPSAVWSRLYYDLLKYFSLVDFDGESLISFYHRKIKETARDYFYSINKEFYHVNLLEYFWNQPTIYEKKEKVNLRKLSELPYHCIKSNSYSKFLELYSENFIDLKLQESQKENILDDFVLILKNVLENNNIKEEYKSELVELISYKLISYLVKKIKDTRSNIISVEDIHAKFMFQTNVSFYDDFLDKVTNKDIACNYLNNTPTLNSFILAFKIRKANLLRREAKLKEASEIYENIISDNLDDLNKLEQSTLYYDMGTISYLSAEPEKAVNSMQKSIDAAIEVGNDTSKYMSMVKLAQIRFVYYDEYNYFEEILNNAFEHFWKNRFLSLSARRFVRGNYALYFDLYYETRNLEKCKMYLEKFKNDNTNVYKSINFISENKELVSKSGCSGFTPYDARINILEKKYNKAAEMFSNYLNIYMTNNDRNTLEFIAKEYYDYLYCLKKIGDNKRFTYEKENALNLPDEPLNKIWKEKIRKLAFR